LRRGTNEEILFSNKETLYKVYKSTETCMVGHLEKMHEERTTKKITHSKPLSSRSKGQPKKKWEDVP
jgi:hypothetical protein